MKIDYIRDKDGEPVNIRGLTDLLPYFTTTQGTCSDGKYIYMVFERKGRGSRTHRCKIVKLDAKTLSVRGVSDELDIGHGNDLTYRGGVLYVTHSVGKLTVHRVDAKTLKNMRGIPVKLSGDIAPESIRGFNGIACYGDGFILRVMGGAMMIVTDKNFRMLRSYKTERAYKTSQGMDQKGEKTYRAYSRRQSVKLNYLAVFDSNGRLTDRKQIEVQGELESVFFVGDELYGSVYRRRKDDYGMTHFEAYVFRIIK